jgi:hypothetical protein
MKKLIFTALFFVSLNSHAQIGDFLKQLGNSLEDIKKTIPSQLTLDKNNNSEKSNRKDENLLKLNMHQLAAVMNGRWATNEINCENRVGYYIQVVSGEDKPMVRGKHDTTISLYDESNMLVLKENYENMGFNNVGGDVNVRLGQFSEWTFKIIANDKIQLNNRLLKPGKGGSQQAKVEPLNLVKCGYKKINPEIVEINGFGIKEFILGGIPPKMGSEILCEPSKYFKQTKYEVCSYDTTILESPYLAIANIFDEKISAVVFIDKIWSSEILNRTAIGKKPDFQIGRLMSINDFDNYLNDIIISIKEKNNNKEPQVAKEKINSINGVSTLLVSELNKPESSIFRNFLFSKCPNCNSTRYTFQWDMPEHTIKVHASVPETKEHPYPFYSVIIEYENKNFNRLKHISLHAIDKMEEERKNLENQNMKKMEADKNANRKKDI